MNFSKKIGFISGLFGLAAFGLVACDDTASAKSDDDQKVESSSSESSTKKSSDSKSEEEESSSSKAKSSSSSAEPEWIGLNPDISFEEFKDSRDKQIYHTVKIGDQVWMAENMNYKTSYSYCYDGKDVNCEDYGRLYTWSEASSVCPTGWHLPTNDDWEELLATAGTNAGDKLKSVYAWNEGAGKDKYGFAALPAGYKTGTSYVEQGEYAGFWSATTFDSNNAYSWRFISTSSDVKKNSLSKSILRSVRCVTEVATSSSSSVKSSSSSGGSSSTTIDFMLEDESDLLDYPCNKTNEGKTAYIEIYDLVVVCENDPDLGKYAWIDHEEFTPALSSSSAKSSSSVASSSSAKSSSSVASSSSVTLKVDPSDAVAGTMTDERDGRTYRTVTIGTQTWMAQNLAYDDSVATKSLLRRTACYKDSCEQLGRYYTFAAAVDSVLLKANGYTYGDGVSTIITKTIQGICPDGWRLPTQGDYSTLISNVGGSSYGAKSLAAKREGGEDLYGFGMLRMGYTKFSSSGFSSYSSYGSYAYLTTSTNSSSFNALRLYFSTVTGNISISTGWKEYGIPVRCIKGDAELAFDRTPASSSSSVESSSSVDTSLDPTSVVVGSLTDTRDGRVYKTVKIGTQTWMAQNLAYDDSIKTSSLLLKSGCKPDSCEQLGRYYTYSAAIDSVLLAANGYSMGDGIEGTIGKTIRGICPVGWRLPTRSDFDTLIINVGGETKATFRLLAVGTNSRATDDYGFGLLPMARVTFRGDTTVLTSDYGKYAFLWSSENKDDEDAYVLEDDGTYTWTTEVTSRYKFAGIPVRCIKGEADLSFDNDD